jgi:putative tricarboxylic transport membrane protein
MKTASRLSIAACALALAVGVLAQTYPTRSIELVAPTGAGRGSDLVARAVAEIVHKEKLLPQQIFVQNRNGGGGAVGLTYVAGKRGDP